MFPSIDQLILWVPAFVIAITIHEASHALVATLLGDTTPRRQGRLTINPLSHLDPLGSILLLLKGFGWGRPVQVNPSEFRGNPLTGMALVAAAGPLSNVLLATLVAMPLRMEMELPGQGARFALTMVIINASLAVFNMIPLPPLDGFSVLVRILPVPMARSAMELARYGPGVLLALFFLPSLLHVDLIGPVINLPTMMLARLVLGA
ncbi:MAG: site-2 protease family protein [Chloroflexota bacterium]